VVLVLDSALNKSSISVSSSMLVSKSCRLSDFGVGNSKYFGGVTSGFFFALEIHHYSHPCFHLVRL